MWHMGSDGAAALGVWLFGDLLSLLLSGVDLCCKARAVHRARWAFGSPRGASVRPLSFLRSLPRVEAGEGQSPAQIPREPASVLRRPREMSLEAELRTAASASHLERPRGEPGLVNTQTALV